MVSNSFISLIKKSIENFDWMRKFIATIKYPIKHYTTNIFKTMERISEDIFTGKLGYGQLITTEGYLSRYFLNHRQDFYAPYSRKVTRSNITPIPFSGGSSKISFELGADIMQLPIQSLPPINIDNKKIFLYFLYYPNLNSFLLDKDEEKEKQLKELFKIKNIQKHDEIENILKIEPIHKPILVTSYKDIGQLSEKVVRITGTIKEPDANILDIFFHEMTFTQREIFENYIRPFTIEPASFCIDIDDKGVISQKESHTKIPALIYIESHLENIFQVPDYKKLIGTSLPGRIPGSYWAKFGEGDLTWGISSSNIYILTNNFDRYAFFVESDLVDRSIYESRLKELSFFAKSFIKGIQKIVRDNYRLEIKMAYDFLFDFKKANLFHPKGVLASKEVTKILEENPELFNTIDWLRKG